MSESQLNTIHMISIKDLYPHPQNPRKKLGDITELSESIRKNGIMQNLTVVNGHSKGKQWVPGGYTIIIGHRRCAAAREAGLKEVPCTIADLDEREQLCTMMEENMQRVAEDVSWMVEKFDYENHDKPWKNSKDAIQRGMQKLKGGYPADGPYKPGL